MERKRMLGVLIALCVVLAGVAFALVWFAIVVPSSQQLEQNRLDIGQESVRIQALEKELDAYRLLLTQTHPQWNNRENETQLIKAQLELEQARQQLVSKQAELEQLQQQLE